MLLLFHFRIASIKDDQNDNCYSLVFNIYYYTSVEYKTIKVIPIQKCSRIVFRNVLVQIKVYLQD